MERTQDCHHNKKQLIHFSRARRVWKVVQNSSCIFSVHIHIWRRNLPVLCNKKRYGRQNHKLAGVRGEFVRRADILDVHVPKQWHLAEHIDRVCTVDKAIAEV